jgi:hypothetical protein
MSQDRTSKPPQTLESLKKPDRLTALSPEKYPMDSNAAIMGAGLEVAHGYQTYIGSRFPPDSPLNLGNAGGFTPQFSEPSLQPVLHARADPFSERGRQNFRTIAENDTRALARPESDPTTRLSGSNVSAETRAKLLTGAAVGVNFMDKFSKSLNPFQ